MSWSLSNTNNSLWQNVCFGTDVSGNNGKFVAVSRSPLTNTGRTMHSTDGVTWSVSTSTVNSSVEWSNICAGNGQFLAIGRSGGNSTTSTLMGSNDGINWTTESVISNGASWDGCTYAIGDDGSAGFVIVCRRSGNPRCAITQTALVGNGVWSIRTSVPALANSFGSICYGVVNGGSVLVAVADSGSYVSSTSTRIAACTLSTMSATNTWVARNHADVQNIAFTGIAFGNGIFVAIASSGTDTNGNECRVMISKDSITWTRQSTSYDEYSWKSICFGTTEFTAIVYHASSLSHLMINSTDGINWVLTPSANIMNSWENICFGNNTFVAVSADSNSSFVTRAMTLSNLKPTLPLTNFSVASKIYKDAPFIITPPVPIPNFSTYALNWTQIIAPPASVNYTSISLSSTGQYQLITRSSAYLPQLSTDYGATWSDLPVSSLNWSCSAISGNGQIQVMCATSQNIYISTNYGSTWTVSLNNSNTWTKIAISSDGSTIAAVANTSSGKQGIYVYYGGTWSQKTSTTISYTSIAVSSNGQYQVACAANSNLFVSTDYGNTWTSKISFQNWVDVAMSASGQYQTALVQGGSSISGRIYMSEDYGNTWTNPFVKTNIGFKCVSMTSSGQYQTAVATLVYYSNDYGKNWYTRNFSGIWTAFSVSSDGEYQLLTANSGGVLRSQCIYYGGNYSYQSLNSDVASISENTVTVGIVGSTSITATQASTDMYKSNSTTATFTVNKALPTLTFQIDPSSNVIYGMTPRVSNISSTNNEITTYTYNSYDTSNNSINTIASIDSSGNITTNKSGSSTIIVSQAGGDNYLDASAFVVLFIDKARPTLTFQIDPSNNITYGITPRISNISSTNNEITTYTYTYNNSDNSVTSIDSSGNITANQSGSSTIIVSQASNDRYYDASASAVLTVNKAQPTLTFQIDPSSNVIYGMSPSVSNISSTNNEITEYTYNSSDNTIASIDSSGNITTNKSGFSTIIVSQASNARYLDASASIVLSVDKARPTLTFQIDPSNNITYGITPRISNISSTNNEITTFTYTYNNSDNSVTSIDSSGNITANQSGSSTIIVSQESNDRYYDASASTILNVAKAQPTLTFQIDPSSNVIYGMTPRVSNISSTNNEITTYTYDSSNNSVASIDSGGNITTNKSGSSTIIVSQASNARYLNASASIVLSVDKAHPTLTFQIDPSNNVTYGMTPRVSNISSTNNEITEYTYGSSDNSVASINVSGNITTNQSGFSTITVSQESNDKYYAASTSAILNVAKAANLINFSIDPSNNVQFGEITRVINITSNNPINSYLFASSATEIASIDGSGNITTYKNGNSNITVYQNENNKYMAGSKSITLNVDTATATIDFVLPKIASGSTPVQITNITTNSDATIRQSSSKPSIATVDSNNRITVHSSGTCSITLYQDANDKYKAGSKTYTLAVIQKPVSKPQSLIWDNSV